MCGGDGHNRKFRLYGIGGGQPRQPGDQAQQKLNREQDSQQGCGPRQTRGRLWRPEHTSDQPGSQNRDQERPQQVREDPRLGVAKNGAQQELEVDGSGGGHSQPVEPKAAAPIRDLPRPRRRGQPGQTDHQTKECLGQAGVQDRYRRRQIPQDGDASQDALADDHSESNPSQLAHGPAGFLLPHPDGQCNRQQSHKGRHQAVAVLIADVPFPGRIQRSVGERPIRDGKARLVPRDQGSGNDQQKGDAGREHRKVVVTSGTTDACRQ